MTILNMQFCPLGCHFLHIWYRHSKPVCMAALWDHIWSWNSERSYMNKCHPNCVHLPMTLWEKICPTTCNTVGCSRDMISGWSSITFSNVSMVFSKPIAVMAFSSEPSSVSRTWLNVAAFRNKGITLWKWMNCCQVCQWLSHLFTGLHVSLMATKVSSLPLPQMFEHGPRTVLLDDKQFLFRVQQQ